MGCVWTGGVRAGILAGGDVSERPKEHASKACVGESPPWVQIPPSPPQKTPRHEGFSCMGGRPVRSLPRVHPACAASTRRQHAPPPGAPSAPAPPGLGLKWPPYDARCILRDPHGPCAAHPRAPPEMPSTRTQGLGLKWPLYDARCILRDPNGPRGPNQSHRKHESSHRGQISPKPCGVGNPVGWETLRGGQAHDMCVEATTRITTNPAVTTARRIRNTQLATIPAVASPPPPAPVAAICLRAL